MSWAVRPATVADAEAIARVHWDSWVATYAGIFPQASFDAFPLAARRDVWHRVAADAGPGRALFVAESDAVAGEPPPAGEVLGFAALAPYRVQPHEPPGQGAGEGELTALYLRPGHFRRGIGRALWAAVLQAAREAGCPALRLWVIAGNPAERFYAAMGARTVGHNVFDAHGTPVREHCCRVDLSIP